jgi:hypothetical protein
MLASMPGTWALVIFERCPSSRSTVQPLIRN